MSKVALFFEKMHKVFKNKAQRCSTPLSFDFILYIPVSVLVLVFSDSFPYRLVFDVDYMYCRKK